MQYDFQLQPGGAQVIDVKGRFFKYKSGVGAIRVTATKGGYIDLLPGQGVWNVDFSSLIVKDKTGFANNGVLIAGDFDFHDDRITGSVEVIDGGKSRTNAGGAFVGYTQMEAAAGKFSMVQIWNPASSNKNVVINQLWFFTDVQSEVVATFSQVQMPTVKNALSKMSSAIQSVATIGRDVQNVMPPGVGGLFDVVTQKGVLVPMKFTEPMVIKPGWGFTVFPSAMQVQLVLNYEFYEESL